MFSALAGLMVIYCIRLFGMDALSYHGVTNPALVAGTAMAWYAIFNGLRTHRLGRDLSTAPAGAWRSSP